MRRIILGALIWSLSIPAVGLAANDASLEDLLDAVEEIVIVTASLKAEKISDAPATVSVVTAEQIKKHGYRSLLDVLEDLPDFKIEKYAWSEHPHIITSRGVPGLDKFVLLLDGDRISAPTNQTVSLFENYPVHFAKQIEIVYGPASALYGADAFSGVINIISADVETNQSTELSGTFGQYNLYNGAFQYARKLSSNADLLVGGQYFYDEQPDMPEYYPEDYAGIEDYDSGTLETTFGPMTPTDKIEDEFQALMKAYAVYVRFKSKDFRVSVFQNYSHIPTALGTPPNNALYNDNAFMGMRLTMGSASYTGTVGEVSSTTTLVGSRFELDPNSAYRNLFTGINRGYKYAFDMMWQLKQQLSWSPRKEWRMIAGLTAEVYSAIPYSADLAAPVKTDEAASGNIYGSAFAADFFSLQYHNVGGFLQSTYAPSDRFSITAGARYDVNSRYGKTFNPRFGLVWNPATTTTVKALYGAAFLAPSPRDAFGHYGSFYPTDDGGFASFFWHLPNPGLDPQKIHTMELSLRQRLGRNLSATLTGYYSKLTDLIAFGADADHDNLYDGEYRGWPVGYIEVTINQGEQTNLGGSLNLNFIHSFSRENVINLRAIMSYVDGDTDDPVLDKAIEIAEISPIIIRGQADWDFKKPHLSPQVIVVSEQRTRATQNPDEGGDPEKRRRIDGYALVDLSGRYNVTSNLAFFMQATNLLDKRYRNLTPGAFGGIEFDGAPQHPRRISGGAQFSY